jgi:hypothetical protein
MIVAQGLLTGGVDIALRPPSVTPLFLSKLRWCTDTVVAPADGMR